MIDHAPHDGVTAVRRPGATPRTAVRRLRSPRLWTVRARITVAATAVMAVCLLLAGAALLLVLYSSLAATARATADNRLAVLVEEVGHDAAGQLDSSALATDSQVAVVQIVDRSGRVVARSAAAPSTALSDQMLAPGATRFLGHRNDGDDENYWVTAAGADTPAGPVLVLVGADREPVENAVTTVAVLMAIGGPVVTALAGFGTHRLIGAALQPVERIRSRVAGMDSRLHERVPVPDADDEIARLAVTMNDMLDRLDAGRTAQQRFVSDASHELRSPLATITAALDLAQRRPEQLTPALVDDLLVPEASRMQSLVEDLLLLARADEHAGRRTVVEVDLDDVVLVEAVRVRSLTPLSVTTSIAPARVLGDPHALLRLVRNLVDNACRHARHTVAVDCAVIGGHARIVVADDGPGIAVADRERVFDRFVRLDQPRDRTSGGSGLGLAIAAHVAASHGGDITIEETAGGGASFVVRLPSAAGEAVADAPDGLDGVAR